MKEKILVILLNMLENKNSTTNKYLLIGEIFTIVFIYLGLITILACVTTSPVLATSLNCDTYHNESASPNEQAKQIDMIFSSSDIRISENATDASFQESKSVSLAPRPGNKQEFYIDNATKSGYDRTDHVFTTTILSNKNLSKEYLHEFGYKTYFLDINGDGVIDESEPVILDGDGNLKLSNSDKIVKNGSVPLEVMNNSNTTYFNSVEDNSNYTSGLAIVKLNNNQLSQGKLSEGEVRIMLQGKAPLTSFSDTNGNEIAFNITKEKDILSKDSAILNITSNGKVTSGRLDSGDTTLLKSGGANLKNFEPGETYHIDSVETDQGALNREEAIFNDSTQGEVGRIDYTDEIVKEGEGFKRIIKENVTNFGSGNIFIGNASNDQKYSSGEFVYAESGENPGYQPEEDIVITGENVDVSKHYEETEDYTLVNGEEKTNLYFIDLNNDSKFTISNEDGSFASDPLLKTYSTEPEDNTKLKTKDRILKSYGSTEEASSITKYSKSENYKDLNDTLGSYNQGELVYSNPREDNKSEYQSGDPIFEIAAGATSLNETDYVLVGGDLDDISAEYIPPKYYFLDVDLKGEYDDKYAVIEKSERDKILRRDNLVIYPGEIQKVNNFGEKIKFIDLDGSKTYSQHEPIIESEESSDSITINDEILHEEWNTPEVQTKVLGGNPYSEFPDKLYYLSPSKTSSQFSHGDTIVKVNPVLERDDSLALDSKEINVFENDFGFIDRDRDGIFDENETIYTEKDTNEVGSNTFGDRLTAITVTNNGSLEGKHIERVSLSRDGTEIANATEQTGDAWVLEPPSEDAWFGPENVSMTVSATVAETAPAGETVSLAIPPLNDQNDNGAYDPGDTGVFFEQDDPTGDIGPGASLTVEQTDEPEPAPEPVDLWFERPPGNSTAAESVSVTVHGDDIDRTLEAVLQEEPNGGVWTRTRKPLDSDGQAHFTFDAPPGEYRLQVRAIEGEGSINSTAFTVRPAVSGGFVSNSTTVERGDSADVGVALENASNTTFQLIDPTGEPVQTITLGNTTAPDRIELDTNGYTNPVESTSIRSNHHGGSGYLAELAWNDGRHENWTARRASRNGSESAEPTPSPDGNGTRSEGNPQPARRRADGERNLLEAGTYTLTVGNETANWDQVTLDVKANWSAAVIPYVAPREADIGSLEDIQHYASHRDVLAESDRLILAVNATDIGATAENLSVQPGHRENGGPPSETQSSASGRSNATKSGEPGPPGFVSVRRPEPAGAGDLPGFERIDGTESGEFYLVSRTSDSGRFPPNATLESAVVLTEASPLVSSGNSTQAGDQISVQPDRATLDRATERRRLDLPPKANVTISGTTTLAPGTKAQIVIDTAQYNRTYTETTTVEDDGTYETTTDLSNAEADSNYTVTVSANDEQISPVYSGSFEAEETDASAASVGGGGWGGGEPGDVTDPTTSPTPTPRRTAEGTAEKPGPIPDPPSFEEVNRSFEQLPRPLRIGLTALVILGLGGLAILTVGIAIKRLLVP